MAFHSSIENPSGARRPTPTAMQGRAIVKRSVFGLVLALAVLAGPAHSAVTFQYLFDGGYPFCVSSDGTVIAGNNVSDYGPFRWTQATGYVSLGRPAYYNAGGSPGMSWDGSRIASSINSDDSTFTTQ